MTVSHVERTINEPGALLTPRLRPHPWKGNDMPNDTPLVRHDRLIQVLDYDPTTGEFRWKTTLSNRGAVGKSAGYTNRNRRIIRVDGGKYLAHRLAWFYVHGMWPNEMVDHINGDTLDNRIANLREATSAQNQQNQSAQRRSSTGLLGASYNTRSGRYYGFIKTEGRTQFLGSYATAIEAHQAYLAAKARLHTFQPRPRST